MEVHASTLWSGRSCTSSTLRHAIRIMPHTSVERRSSSPVMRSDVSRSQAAVLHARRTLLMLIVQSKVECFQTEAYTSEQACEQSRCLKAHLCYALASWAKVRQ